MPQLVVPDAMPLPPRSLAQLTDVTPTLSEALPFRDTVAVDDVKVGPDVGLEIAMDGTVVSAAGALVIDHEKVCPGDCSTPSYTLAVTEYVPAVVGVPEMNPVAVPTKSPGGRPVALYVTACPSGSLPANWRDFASPTFPLWAPGLVSEGNRLLYPHTWPDFGPSPAELYAATAKQYCCPATAVGSV
jgi:hypothetical protein